MIQSYKPADYNSVSPYLVVDDGPRMIALLQKIFDAREIRRFNNPDGAIVHAEIMLDDSVIMLAEETADYPANQLLLHVYVPDVDQTFQKALDQGCKALREPTREQGEPDKRGEFQDYNGNTWSIATTQTGIT